MLNSENKLTPDSKYLVLNTCANQDLNQSVLDNLYLPIIGHGALQLYLSMWSISKNDHNRIILHNHYELQSMLNVGVDKLLRYRQRLEAIHLLKTSLSVNSEDHLVYDLFLPLTATEFLKTDFLSALLLGKVGEETYRQLVARLFLKKPDVGELRDISAGFLDVFPTSESSVKSASGFVNELKRSLPNETGIASKAFTNPTVDQFDFNLLLATLQNSYVDLKSVKQARDLILSENALYGIDEIKMSKLILKATNLNNNKLDQKNLKFIISRQFSKPNGVPKKSNQTESATSSASKTDVSELTESERQLVKIARENAPMVFLQQLKTQKGGFVTDNEQRTVQEILDLGIFPTEVVNMLVYYVLVDRDRSTLTKAYILAIADGWSQTNKVVDAPSAILALRERTKKSQEATAKRKQRRYSNGRPVINEVLPDWAKERKAEEAAKEKAAAEKSKKTKKDEKAIQAEADRKRELIKKELERLHNRD